MTETLNVLDGYAVFMHPGDRYTHAHLYIKDVYIHVIIFAPDGTIFLKDAAAFTGARRDFTTEEITALCQLRATVQTAYEARQAARTAQQAHQAARVRETTNAKVLGMEDVRIYD